MLTPPKRRRLTQQLPNLDLPPSEEVPAAEVPNPDGSDDEPIVQAAAAEEETSPAPLADGLPE